ncbi:unnamed protein product, partial [Rodentolepis nana]|uniref:CREPT domain-containing protein n=1 Tax=Rodentolepis nana TaxID=102285 RepID=A0A0R3U041_RODNA
TKASGEPSCFDFSFTAALLNSASAKSSKLQYHQKTPSLISPSAENTVAATPTTKFFSPRESSLSPRAKLREEMQQQHHDLLSASIKPPETMELVQKLDALQNSAPSANVATRQKISEFPAEVSNPEEAAKMIAQRMDKEALIQRIRSALSQLEVYNASLDEEMTQRQNLSSSLRAYKQALRESCQNVQSTIQVRVHLKCLIWFVGLLCPLSHGICLTRSNDAVPLSFREKRALIGSMQNSLDSHICNLPDDQKPEAEFLEPLPSVGDLFR